MPSGYETFLNDVQIDHGPVDLLTSFFLLAEDRLARIGVTLYRTTLKEARSVQPKNQESWAMFPPMLDTDLSDILESESFGLVGLNKSGDPVCVQAGRLYNSGTKTLVEMVPDGTLCYGPPPHKSGNPVAGITAPTAAQVSGTFMYSGGLWVHPEYRGQKSYLILPRVSRSLALAQWDTQWTLGMVRDYIKPENLAGYGYKIVEPDFTFTGLAPEKLRWLLMIMDRARLIEDLREFIVTNLIP